MSGSGRDTLSDVRKWSGGHRKFAGVVGRFSRMSGSGLEALSRSRKIWESLLDIRK